MKFKMCAVVGMAAMLAGGLGGCASVNPVVQKEAAPVSFKMGQGDYRSASLRTPRSSLSPVITPEVRREARRESSKAPVTPRRPIAIAPVTPAPVAPSPVTPRQPQAVAPAIPAPKMPKADFDKSEVDKALYAHLRIGKRYTVFGKSYTPKHQPNYDKTGTASWYGPKFHGKPTASGEAFDMNGLSAAHKTLPLNSLVHVENTETGASLILRVNDRGPFVGNRIIDLSKGAAKQLGLLDSGLKEVRVRYAGPADPNTIGKKLREPKSSLTAEAPAPAVKAKPAPKPDMAAPEGFNLDSYTPLRKLPDASVSPMASVPAPRQSAPRIEAPAQPFIPQYAPQAPVTPEADDGPLTLTIKGPIHMATSRTLPGAENIVAASTRN